MCASENGRHADKEFGGILGIHFRFFSVSIYNIWIHLFYKQKHKRSYTKHHYRKSKIPKIPSYGEIPMYYRSKRYTKPI